MNKVLNMDGCVVVPLEEGAGLNTTFLAEAVGVDGSLSLSYCMYGIMKNSRPNNSLKIDRDKSFMRPTVILF